MSTTLTRRVKALGTPSLAWLWYALPLLFVAHAIVFWGRGLLDEEGMLYIQRYLADRPLLATIFDPNDATLYQAREVSYLFDVADARVLAWLVDQGRVLFIPASGALGLVAAALVYLRGARKTFHFEASTSSLLLTLFLSCIVTQASTAIFYRSAKMVLCVALFAFLFYVASLLRDDNRSRALSFWRVATVFLLGLVMSLTDRQGLFYLLTTAVILALLWLTARVRRDPRAASRLTLAAACVAAALAVAVYGEVVAPWMMAWTNGARVTLTSQQRPISDLDWTVLSHGFEVFRAQVVFLFGNAPFAAVVVVALTGAAFAVWRNGRPSGDVIDLLIGAVVVPVALVVLLAVMILNHPPIYSIPDHRLWYYTLTLPAVLVFGLTLILANVDLTRARVTKYVVHAVLLGMIVSNVLHYREQRHRMIESPYISEQFARTRLVLANDDAARLGRSDPGQRPWLRVEPAGAVVALPVEDEAFPREVQAAFATYRHRAPLDEAAGPYWARVYEYLINSPALFDDPHELAGLVDGLRSVGVRRIELDQTPAAGDARARPTADALRATGQTTGETTIGNTIAFDLAAAVPPADSSPLRAIPAGSFRATASHDSGGLSRAFDGDKGTFWSTDAPQAGDEWIRIEFDRPIDVGCVRLLFNAANPGRNPVQSATPPRTGRQAIFKESFRPRGLVIVMVTEDHGEIVMPFNPLGALIQALLRNPVSPAMEFRLSPNRSRTLVLRQTGRSATDPWNVSELTIWERR